MRDAYEIAFFTATAGAVLVVAAVLWQAVKNSSDDEPISTVLSWALVAAILFVTAMIPASLAAGTFHDVMDLGTLLPYAAAFGLTTAGVIWLCRRPVKPGRLLGRGSAAYLLPIAAGVAAGAVGAL
jgi:ABC-type polysaccharide/polyol phosphate export permease